MLWFVSASGTNSFQSKGFRAPPAPELLSLCVLKEKVTKEKEHPASALSGRPARKVRVRATGFFDSTSCAGEKLAGIPAGHPAGFPSPARRCRGAPGRAARILRALFRRARARASFCFSASSPSAGHDGPPLYRGPLRGGETGSTGRAAGVDRDVGSFSPGQESGRKARPRLTDLPGREPGKRQAGWPFSLVIFLFGHAKRK